MSNTGQTLVYARWVTKQTWTATVSAILFVLLAAVIALVPVPYVSWSPGSTVDLLESVDGKPRVQIGGTEVYPVTGQLRLTTVAVTSVRSQLTLPEALLSYWLPAREVLPRGAVYPAGTDAGAFRAKEVQAMDTSQSKAIAAALRAAELPVQEVPQVATVPAGGPAIDKLKPGDYVTAVDGTKVSTIQAVKNAIHKHAVGESVVFEVLRGGETLTVTVATSAANNAPATPVVGITLEIGYIYAPTVTFAINPDIGGPSAGLMFAVAVYDEVTPGDLIAGRSVAGTGTLTGSGQVGEIGGIQEKIAGAERAGASIFLVPAENCVDARAATTSMRLVKVATLSDALTGLAALADPARADTVAGCQ